MLLCGSCLHFVYNVLLYLCLKLLINATLFVILFVSPLVESVTKINFISQPKHMLRVLKRNFLIRRFF